MINWASIFDEDDLLPSLEAEEEEKEGEAHHKDGLEA